MIKINQKIPVVIRANNTPLQSGSCLLNEPACDSVSFGNTQVNQQQKKNQDNTLLGLGVIVAVLVGGAILLSKSLGNAEKMLAKAEDVAKDKADLEKLNIESRKLFAQKQAYMDELARKISTALGNKEFDTANASLYVNSKEFENLVNNIGERQLVNINMLQDMYKLFKEMPSSQYSPDTQKDIVKILQKLQETADYRNADYVKKQTDKKLGEEIDVLLDRMNVTPSQEAINKNQQEMDKIVKELGLKAEPSLN